MNFTEKQNGPSCILLQILEACDSKKKDCCKKYKKGKPCKKCPKH